MGHIHKTNFEENKKIIYPGSPISFGFDELGEHGMIVGELENHVLKTEFMKLDEREFVKYEFEVDGIDSKEELAERINSLSLKEKNFYEVVLTGKRDIEINVREILMLIQKSNVLKIKDCTSLKYNIEKIANENNLRGIFIRELLKKYETGMYSEKQIEKAIEIGLQSMQNL